MAASVLHAKRAAREAEDSKPVERLARFGFVARGFVYVVIGLLGLRIAVGDGGRADRAGALAAIKEQVFGAGLLVALSVGFAGYAGWRLLQAAVGHRDADEGVARTLKRLGSLVRAGLYAFFAVTTLHFITAGPGPDRTRSFTARVMALPAGHVLVGLVGGAFVGTGLYMAYRGIAKKFLKHLDLSGASATARRVATRVGQLGLVGRGLVLGVIGGFGIESAITFDPNKAKGLDTALKSLATEPFGRGLLVLAAVGLLAFGAWSFVEARYRDV